MRIRVLTLFPDMVETVLSTSILGRAREAGLLDVRCIDIRDHAGNRYGKVDDTLYGGGTGMLLMCEPVYAAWREARNELGDGARTIFLSAQGTVFRQRTAARLAEQDALILLCGHYEGVDQRVLDEIVDEEISIGDYVLTGGELPALTVIDAVARLLPGVLPSEEAYLDESHTDGLLEGWHYTRPPEWHGEKVPDVLLSGHHVNIQRFRRLSGLWNTMKKRPDLLQRHPLSTKEWEELEHFARQQNTGRGEETDHDGTK